MAHCVVCGKEEEDTQLFDGVFDGRITKICYPCSLAENVALIKRPTREQLAEADKRQSVKQLMEKLSSPQQKIMTKDQAIAHKNLNKIKFPAMKQEHGDLVPNYDWVLKNARRRAKLSVTQLSEQTSIDKAQIESLETGQLFNGFEKIAEKLEKALNVKILIRHELIGQMIRLPKKDGEEKEILEEVTPVVEKKSWFSFFKKRKEEKEKNEITEPIVEDYEAFEEEPQEQIEVPIVAEKKQLSPWMSAREFERKNSPYQRRENRTSEIKQTDTKNKDELKKQVNSGEFDFSRKENIEKITLQDLAELKKLKENSKNKKV